MTFEYIALLVILLAIIGEMWRRSREARRADFIRKYTLPPGLF